MTFEEHISTFMNKEEIDLLKDSLKKESISSFKVNSAKVGQIYKILENVEIKPLSDIKNGYCYNKQINELGKSIEFKCGAFYIQEPAAMLAETLLDINPGENILDMCAAPGGKSFDALDDLKGRGLLVCNDINPLRTKILSSNIEKYGFKNAIVLNDDSSKYSSSFLSFFDKIILDAPCSGSGMFRKDEYAIKDWSIEKVYQCQKIQKSLLEDAYKMLKGQGKLLYSTCSFSYQENEEVIQDFLVNHPDMEIINIDLNKKYNDTYNIKGGLRLYPFKYNGEGQVMFLLKKNGSEVKGCKKIKDNNKQEKLVQDFLDSINYKFNKVNIVKFKDQYYLCDYEKVDVFKYNVLRYGLHLGYIENNRFIPSHSLAMANDMNKELYVDLTEAQAKEYLRGLQINIESNKKGMVIASYKGLPLGWGKITGCVLKNHLPKGLRVL